LEAGREPGVATEEVTEGVEFADAPFGGGGQVGLDEGELGESFEGPPAASGTALLDLDGPDCPPGFIVGEDFQVRAGGAAPPPASCRAITRFTVFGVVPLIAAAPR
jgi:hypothetical protein